jgi:hypothetical protein
MLTDTQIESMLEGHFDALSTTETVIDARLIVATYRRHQRRVRLSFAGVAFATVALVTMLPLAIGGGGSRGQSSFGEAVHLGSYTLRLPSHYRLVDDATSQCWAVAVFQVPASSTTAINDGSPYTNEVIASDIEQQGACVAMAITIPYSMSVAGVDPFEVSGSQSVSIGDYAGWIYTTTGGLNGGQEVELGVEIPSASGQYQDIVVGALGLTENTIEAIVANALSSSS